MRSGHGGAFERQRAAQGLGLAANAESPTPSTVSGPAAERERTPSAQSYLFSPQVVDLGGGVVHLGPARAFPGPLAVAIQFRPKVQAVAQGVRRRPAGPRDRGRDCRVPVRIESE